MIKDYTYIKQQIARSKGSFQMDCCKMSTELFWFKWKNVVTSHDMYQDLLGMIAKKLKLKIDSSNNQAAQDR